MAKNFSAGTVGSFRAAARKINAAAQKLGVHQGQGLRMIGEEIMTDVKDARPGHGVPVKDGHLRGSGRVEGPFGSKEAPTVSLSFGGASAPYALIQHEVTTFHHTVGEPRYLVRGLERWRENKSSAIAWMRKQFAADLKGV